MTSDRPAPSLADYLEARLGEAEHIASERRAALDDLARAVSAQLASQGAAHLVFVCTHNSRRSQFGQVWSAVAAGHLGVPGIRTWSGGTEATDVAQPAVAALRRAGLQVDEPTAGHNPAHLVRAGNDKPPLHCWSKRIDDPHNPSRDFIAVMTCSSADQDCPVVPGAAHRIALTYEDPKVADGTPDETAAYDDRCRQIAREMLYLFTRLK